MKKMEKSYLRKVVDFMLGPKDGKPSVIFVGPFPLDRVMVPKEEQNEIFLQPESLRNALRHLSCHGVVSLEEFGAHEKGYVIHPLQLCRYLIKELGLNPDHFLIK